MKKSILFYGLVFIGIMMYSCENSQGQSYNNVDVTKAEEMIKSSNNVVILDVRTQQEYNEGHLENALNIDFYGSDFDAQIQKLDKEKTYVVICRAGGRSAKTSEKMASMGFKNVNNMEGGFTEWSSAGKPSSK